MDALTRISVLHVAQPTTYGVAHYVAALASRQHERGWRVSVASPSNGSLLPRSARVRRGPPPVGGRACTRPGDSG